jgi:ribosomal protein S18 acetylase RimI-like enzyme
LHLGRGIGTTLVRLTEARGREVAFQAPAGSTVAINNWINARNADARALLEREGYQPVRNFWRMEAALPAEPEAPVWPEGITLHSAAEDGDLRPFYDTVEEAMADHWGHVDRSFAEWVDRRTGATFDPGLWYLATEGEAAAGAVLCSIGDGVGWVDTLVVRRPWRRRGLGLALLRHAFAAFARRGIRRVQLSVDADSPTGATRLYERAGMRVVQEHAGYGKVMGDGVMG